MKQVTKIRQSLAATAALAVLLTGMTITGTATAQSMESQLKSGCNSGFGGIWIIGNSCDLGSATELQTDDAMVVQCNDASGAWSIDFYAQSAAGGQARQYPLCPGNGRLVSNADGELVLRCNYWEALDNVAKQLDLQLQPSNEPNIRSISWQASDLDNPNVVCGVAGRPEGGTGVGSGGQTID